MARSSLRRERGLWPRSLALVALLAAGTACGGGDARSADGNGAKIGRAGQAQPAAAGQRQVVPSSLGAGPDVTAEGILSRPAGATPAPPPPDLGTRHPQAPPDTVSLDALHQQGRTHVLR